MAQQVLEFAWGSDKGLVREGNEDAVSVLPEERLAIVADGIGGASAGEVASNLAVRAIGDRFRSREGPPVNKEEAREILTEAIKAANWEIWDASTRTHRRQGMGTTVVVGYAGSDWLVYAHVGDSRIYLLRDSCLIRLTKDHSLIQEVVDQGFFPTVEEAHEHGVNSNILTRGLGTLSLLSVDCGDIELLPGDIFLFCTDGLTGMVSDKLIQEVLSLAEADLGKSVKVLIALAHRGGGVDNITVALMRVS